MAATSTVEEEAATVPKITGCCDGLCDDFDDFDELLRGDSRKIFLKTDFICAFSSAAESLFEDEEEERLVSGLKSCCQSQASKVSVRSHRLSLKLPPSERDILLFFSC